jgi:hypothetical protein
VQAGKEPEVREPYGMRRLRDRRWYALYHQNKTEEAERVLWLSFEEPRPRFCQEKKHQALHFDILPIHQRSEQIKMNS